AGGQADRPRREGVLVGGDGRLARRGWDPRRGHPPGPAARPDLRPSLDERLRDAQMNVLVSEDPAAEVAQRLARAAEAGSHIALTGGSTPKVAYEKAAALDADWSGATLWWGDERCVAPDDE